MTFSYMIEYTDLGEDGTFWDVCECRDGEKPVCIASFETEGEAVTFRNGIYAELEKAYAR